MAELDEHHEQEQGQVGNEEPQEIKEQAPAVRRSDNQGQAAREEQAGAVMRPDNQDQTAGEEQAPAVSLCVSAHSSNIQRPFTVSTPCLCSPFKTTC